MTEQSDAARLEEIASVDRPPFFLTLTRDEYDFLIALASRAVEQQRGRDADSIENVRAILHD